MREHGFDDRRQQCRFDVRERRLGVGIAAH
jgi:hypothetical protein